MTGGCSSGDQNPEQKEGAFHSRLRLLRHPISSYLREENLYALLVLRDDSRDGAKEKSRETWQWCKTLMDSHTRFNGAEEMRKVVCFYALCDETNIIMGVGIMIVSMCN